jgi:Fur family transcriptional regulator, ferric uptake regulator
VRGQDPWGERTLAALREGGLRLGSARRAVVEALAEQGCAVTATEIHDQLRAAGREVGIASVYRILDLLVERGLVQKIDLGGGRAHYEAAHRGDAHHHHLVCTECGKVEPFADAELEAALERIETQAGYRVRTHDVLLRGACDDCAA